MNKLIIDVGSTKDWPLEGKAYSKLFGGYIKFFAEHENIEYSKRCIEYFNSFDDKLIDELCKASIRYCNEFLGYVGEPAIEFISIRDVLKIISPNFIKIPEPLNGNEPVLHMDLNCEWEPEHGMEWIIRGNDVLYVGQYANEDPWGDYSFKEDWNYAE